MTDLRYDPVFGRWSSIARNRSLRPYEFQQSVARYPGLRCPFCQGHEDATPLPIAEFMGDESGDLRIEEQRGTDDWLVRAVPNKYPSLGEESGPTPNGEPTPYPTFSEPGLQEVIVLSPRHVCSLSELLVGELETSFFAIQQRLICHRETPGIAHSVLFMNCRAHAGATIEHVHFQLVGAPICTEHVQRRHQRMQASSDKGLLHELTSWEARQTDRLLDRSGNFTVFCPFASRFPYQLWIVPDLAQGPFTALSRDVRNELAELCRKWVARLESVLVEPAYNLIFHLPPQAESELPWLIELVPRLSRAAGFELSTDLWINPVPPETAAEQLRGAG